MTYLVKICGNMYMEDSLRVARHEPDFMGWIFSPKSLRQVTLEDAVPVIEEVKKLKKKILHVAVFAENSHEEILNIISGTDVFDLIQIAESRAFINEFCGLVREKYIHKSKFQSPEILLNSERPAICPALRVREEINDEELLSYGKFPLYILDSYVQGKPGGTGKSLNPHYINQITLPYLLAGGLNADNVESSLLACSAVGADVSSGIEDSPGRKNIEKLKAFIEIVRNMK